jgi:tetratricopeptide (TPR) repeat protein/predicted Ser/Thr protein kinase
MNCAVCEQPNPEGTSHCSRCSSIMPPPRSRTTAPGQPSGVGAEAPAGATQAPRATVDDLLRDLAHVPETRAPTPLERKSSFAPAVLSEGTHLGPRYEIVRQLGKGGMGAVYLAYDRELSRLVALKVVALHLAGEDWVVERFKREIHLSSLVTHPNVLRVFDLGEHEGLKFLTMQYIEGDTLDGLMRRERRLPVEWSLSIFRQLCGALGAAHAKGILHRDLKPQNVLIDKDRTAFLTDFGLATASTLSPMTQAGALMGTPHYMSPEQVKGLPLDGRSDLFSCGVMLYEMLAGVRPYAGDSVYDLMMARVRDTARPVSELNADVPPWLQQVVEKCLAVEPADRFQRAEEILSDLDAEAVRPAAQGRAPSGKTTRQAIRAKPGTMGGQVARARRIAAVAGAVAALLLGTAAYVVIRSWPSSPPSTTTTTRTVLVADFDNRTGEDVFNGTLEPALGLTLEGAPFISAYSRTSALKLADRLKLEGTGLMERRARLVAQREGISTVVAGFVERDGKGYRVGARTLDAFTGQKIVESSELAGEKGAVLAAASRLAASVRRALGDVTPVAQQLKEAETFSAASLEAAHEYSVASDLAATQGKYDEARKHYLEAIRIDPAMGRAYAGLAVTEANRGHAAEAETHYRKALEFVDRMTEREKFRTRGGYYTFRRDADKAVEAYQALVRQFPADNAGLANLGLGYVFKGDFQNAVEYTQRALALYPQNVPQRNNLGFFAMYAGNLETALQEQTQVLESNPGFVNGHIGLALALAAAGRRDEAQAAWKRLAALGPSQAATAAEGLADLAALEGRLAEARTALEPALAADLAAKDADGAARKLVLLGEIALARGDKAGAAQAAERAVAQHPQDYVLYLAGRLLAAAGNEKRALALADPLARTVEPASRHYAELLQGEVALHRQKPQEALDRFKAAQKLLDSWLVHEGLGRAYLAAGAGAQAADELEACLRRRGEVTDVFIDNVPTWRLLGPVEYWRGRALEAQKLPAAADAYRAFLAQKKGAEDPLMADARRRLGGQ